VLGYRRLRARTRSVRHHKPVLGTRGALFLAGYAVLWVALISPLHPLGEELFSVHMVQHILLTLVAPPLLLLSNSMPVLLWAFPQTERRGLGRLIGQPGRLQTALRWLTRPAVAWTLFVCTQWLWHTPAAYQWALGSRWAHYVEHVSFFATAILFWWPVIGAPPLPSLLGYPARMAYTFLAWLPNTLLGAGIALSRGILYPYYSLVGQRLGVDVYGDQQLAGLIMWVPGDVLFAVILLLLFGAYLRHEEREAERIDRELDQADRLMG
jgi:cytochrome c oxidase assembly factor CtaG